MANNLMEALKNIKGEESSNIKLISGEVIKGAVKSISDESFEIIVKKDGGAGSPCYTIPFAAVLYISDCSLPE